MSHSPDEAAETLAEASALYAAGQIEAAAEAVARAEAAAAGSPALWELKGAIALAAGQAGAAAEALGQALTLARAGLGVEPVELRLGLATALERAGRGGEAAEVLAAASGTMADDLATLDTAAARQAVAARVADIETRRAGLLWQAGRQDEAIAAMVLAAKAVPDTAATLDPLAGALAWTLRLAEGVVVCLHLAMLDPQAAEPARNLARFLSRLGAEAAARAWFREALTRDPGDAAAHEALAGEPAMGGTGEPGIAALAAGVEAIATRPINAAAYAALARHLAAPDSTPPGAQPADWTPLAHGAAVAVLRRVLARDPAQPGAALLLAERLSARHDDAQAEVVLRGALKLAPADARLHAALGDVLRQQWRMDAAAGSYRAALALEPETAQRLVNLAVALFDQSPSEEPVELLRRAMAMAPGSLEAQGNLAIALHRLQRHGESLEALRPVLAARPGDGMWHFMAATAHLALGDYAAGWPAYAWRWRLDERDSRMRAPADPLQRPDPASWRGKTILLYAEQGLGDTIQALRYARLAVECGARVLLEVQPALKALAQGIPGIAGVHALGEMAPPHDEAVPLLHLPWAFGTTLQSIPARIPYLRPDLTRAASWRRRVQGLPGLKVGLVWSGDPRPHAPIQASMDRRRSVKLAALAPLVGIPGVIFVSLQTGAPSAQAATPPAGMVLHDWTDELIDFAETAALMSALDLVISVDTAPLHLAGALGRETWLLNRVDSDWRWLTGRDDSPWYPTLRQFRQARPGDWDEVVSRVAVALRERARRE